MCRTFPVEGRPVGPGTTADVIPDQVALDGDALPGDPVRGRPGPQERLGAGGSRPLPFDDPPFRRQLNIHS